MEGDEEWWMVGKLILARGSEIDEEMKEEKEKSLLFLLIRRCLEI